MSITPVPAKPGHNKPATTINGRTTILPNKHQLTATYSLTYTSTHTNEKWMGSSRKSKKQHKSMLPTWSLLP